MGSQKQQQHSSSLGIVRRTYPAGSAQRVEALQQLKAELNGGRIQTGVVKQFPLLPGRIYTGLARERFTLEQKTCFLLGFVLALAAFGMWLVAR